MKIFSRSIKSSRDSFERSVRLTRRTATVTISAPEAAWARAISGKLRYLPLPTIKRGRKARPAITSESDMVDPTLILERTGGFHVVGHFQIRAFTRQVDYFRVARDRGTITAATRRTTSPVCRLPSEDR